MRLIDRAARQGVKQFVFASSASVYGLKSEPNVTEDLELVPISEYNKTKMVAERVVKSYGDQMVTTNIRPATVCGWSPRMRLDVVVNLLTMQALKKGELTVLGGDQTRPNIHIDDMVDLYLFVLEQRLAGTYNAGFENISVLDIAEAIRQEVNATITIKPSNDPRSYRVNSDRLLATGFRPTRTVQMAIREMVQAYRDGRLSDDPICYNVKWMQQHNFG
jgi:nucleoside-diphosphate-sugar epimerase